MAKLFEYWKSDDKRDESEENWKQSLVLLFTFPGVVIFSIFGAGYIFEAKYFSGVIFLVLVLLASLNLIYLKLIKNTDAAASNSVLIMLGALLLIFILPDLTSRVGIYWYFVAPFVVSVLVERKKSYFYSLSLVVLTIIAHLLAGAGVLPTNLGVEEMMQVLIVYVTMVLLTHFYGDTNLQFERDLKSEKSMIESKVVERTSELKNSQARLESSVNSLPVGVFIMDNDHNVIMVNTALKGILSISSSDNQEVIRVLKDKAGFGTDKICKACRLSTSVETLKEVQFGGRMLKIVIAPVIVFPEGRIKGTVVLVEDITEDINLERSKDEFIAIISHELRTPLTAIEGNAHLLHDNYFGKLKSGGGVDQDFDSMIGDLTEASSQMVELVNKVVDLYQIQQGKLTVNHEMVDLVSVVKVVLAGWKARFDNKNLFLKFQTGGQSIQIRTDKKILMDVLDKVIGNAYKFTEKGGLIITLEDKKAGVELRFSDTGIGIIPENQALLFKRFQQTEKNIYTRPSSGIGLGLYMAKKEMYAIGGDITLAESTPDKGSEFLVLLPSNGKNTHN